MATAVDRFDRYIGVLTILWYPVIEKNILLPNMLYVIFLHWDENQVYYKTEVCKLYEALHRDLSQFVAGSFLR